MRNKKLKKIEQTIRLNVLEQARDEDYCGVWLALLDSGISRPRVLKLFDEFHERAVPIYQRDALDGALEMRLDKFVKSVQIPRETFEQIIKRHHNELSAMFPTGDSYRGAVSSNTTDFLVLMHYIHIVLGYGHIRLLRIIDFIMKYEGNAREEVQERLNIEYAAENELAYNTDMLRAPKQKVDTAFVKRAKKEMEAVRMIQEVNK